MLVTRIYAAMEEIPPNYNLAAAFSLLLAHQALLEGRSYVVIGGRAYRPARISLGGWRWACRSWRSSLYGTLLILLLAYVTRFLPYGHRAAEVGLLGLGRELEEASRTCGAPWWRTLWRVAVPLIQPALLYVREFPMSLLLARAGTETLSVALYALLLHQPAPATASFALLQVAILLGAAYALRRSLVAEIGPVRGR